MYHPQPMNDEGDGEDVSLFCHPLSASMHVLGLAITPPCTLLPHLDSQACLSSVFIIYYNSNSNHSKH